MLKGETRAKKEPSGGHMLQEDQDTPSKKRTFEKPASLNEKANFQVGSSSLGMHVSIIINDETPTTVTAGAIVLLTFSDISITDYPGPSSY